MNIFLIIPLSHYYFNLKEFAVDWLLPCGMIKL